MNSSLISFSGLHNGSFRTKLAMEFNSCSHVQNGEETKRSKEEIEINPSSLIMKPAISETKNERTFSFGSTEHLALPTVFEGKITNERKISEKLSTVVNLRRSGSNQDVRGADPRPLSPFPSQFLPQKSLDDNSILQLKGVRRIQRNFSSPLPTEEKETNPLGLGIRGRALSDSPAEALGSPVIPRRHFDSENYHNPEQSRGGVSCVKSCPAIKADSNEPLTKFPLPLTISPLAKSPSTNACPTLKPTDQAGRLPQIHHTHSPMLVRTRKTPDECARELFNVSPIMDQSANPPNESGNNNLQCNVTDKVEYYLYSMSVEDDNT